MDEWDQSFVVPEVEGYLRFDPGERVEFQFGYVHGWMTCEPNEKDGRPAVEWTWEGNDEMDAATGRGWVVFQEDGTLKGKLFFHRGDRSGFTAIWKVGSRKDAGPRMKVVRLKKPSD